jgi:hypothetical protein
MGFLDALFPKAKAQAPVGEQSLDSWLRERMDDESRAAYAKAKPVLKEAALTLERLREGVDALELEGMNDIDPRYDKIVRTAKPSYVKTMRLVLDNLKQPGQSLQDVEEYRLALSAALAAIAKSSFGDGKFLQFAYQQQMVRIQAECKRLLARHDELNAALENKQISALREISRKRQEHSELKAKASKVRQDGVNIAASVGADEQRLAQLNNELEALRSGQDYARVNSLKERIAGLESEASGFDSEVHMAVSPLKSSLRKYEKAIVDPAIVKLVVQLQETPLETFIAAAPGEIEPFLADLEEACRVGRINLKDADKVVHKIAAARSRLTDEYRARWHELIEEIGRLRRELDAIPAASSEQRLLNDIHALSFSVENNRRAAVEADYKSQDLDEKADRVMDELRRRLAEMGVELAS